ncbi:MAG: alkaline phosphatase family protein [Gemmatimonadaceae bacterium]
MPSASKVIVIGLDGMDPTLADGLLAAGELPNLARLSSDGGYARIATTTPAQTPVAWSTFATGLNPGGHGIYDFLRRDPTTYLPDLALSRYEQRSVLLPPRAVNLRSGTPVWTMLASRGLPSTVVRCPCTYPPDEFDGRILAGMGVPDVRGGLGTSTFYSTAIGIVARESEQVITLDGAGPTFATSLPGPRDPKRGNHLTSKVVFTVDATTESATLVVGPKGARVHLKRGEWSSWCRVRFSAGLLTSVAGIVRFLLVRTAPHVELYASPVNFDPAAPIYPISHPWSYAHELERSIGLYHTIGMPEDHTGLSNERFSEDDFLAQCDGVMREREAMLHHELQRFRSGMLYCLFDTPDRLQHMFWRYREADHPANLVHGFDVRYASVIEDHYRRCDAIVGDVLRAADDQTLVMVLSDHGFTGFRRGVHLNAWLAANGWLSLRPGVDPGEHAGEFLRNVDWARTRAYAVGFGSIYLNVAGREAEGIVSAEDRPVEAARLAGQLSGLRDAERGAVAVRSVGTREQLYRGNRESEAPDVVVGFSHGYRASWTTALGGVPEGLFEDNTRKWAGDHIVDPTLVPGVLFMNRKFRQSDARLVDCTPTVLSALGADVPAGLDGRSLLI